MSAEVLADPTRPPVPAGLPSEVGMVGGSRDDVDGGLCHVADGPVLAAETARRVTCGGHQVVVAEDGRGGVVGVGRRTRRVPIGLMRALAVRDGGCVFPGCDAQVGTEAHHVVHWADGGRTDLGNMASLCRFHHHRLHEDGFTMRRHGDGGWVFVRPDGRELGGISALGVARNLQLPAACREVAADACVSAWDGGYLDRYATNVIIEHLLVTEGISDQASALA